MKKLLRILFVMVLTGAILTAAAPLAFGGFEIPCLILDPLPLCCFKIGGPQQVHSAICVDNGQVFRTTICTGPCIL